LKVAPWSNVMLESASILAYHGKAYLTTEAKLGLGSYIPVDPVLVTTLTIEGLETAIAQLCTAGHPPGPQPLTRAFWKTYKEPLQKATRARSQKQLLREGLYYTILWAPDQILVSMPKPNPLERVRDAHGVPRVFPPDTPIRRVLASILEHMQQLAPHAR
jgi:hypothetical protein